MKTQLAKLFSCKFQSTWDQWISCFLLHQDSSKKTADSQSPLCTKCGKICVNIVSEHKIISSNVLTNHISDLSDWSSLWFATGLLVDHDFLTCPERYINGSLNAEFILQKKQNRFCLFISSRDSRSPQQALK